MKRAMGTLLGIVLFALLIPEAAADECGYYSEKQLKDWRAWLSTPHYAGGKEHNDFLDELEKALRAVKGVTVDPQERSFTRWVPVQPTIEGKDLISDPKQIWPLPYSGLTGKAGVTAKLYYEGCVGLDWHFDTAKHAGKIVVLKLKPTLLLQGLLVDTTQQAIPWWRHLFTGEYRRAISFEAQVPSLREAQMTGVAGMIVVFDADPAIAQGQYVPFTRALHDVPAVYVDRDLGAKVIALAKKRGTVTLRHYGSLDEKATTRHLLATLPATKATLSCPTQDEAIVITTHTDGPNWFEDNGPVALWALLNSFANEKCRPRDLVFVFAAAHFAHEPGSTDDVIRRNPELFARTRAAVAIEHLGAVRYGSKSRASEPMLVLTTKHDRVLNRLTMRVVKAKKSLRPVHISYPGYLDYGEGLHLEAAGIPSIGFLSNPAYLLQEYKSWHDEWFSEPLMCDQIDMLRGLIDGMMRMGPQD